MATALDTKMGRNGADRGSDRGSSAGGRPGCAGGRPGRFRGEGGVGRARRVEWIGSIGVDGKFCKEGVA
jgi:hypothetical protein